MIHMTVELIGEMLDSISGDHASVVEAGLALIFNDEFRVRVFGDGSFCEVVAWCDEARAKIVAETVMSITSIGGDGVSREKRFRRCDVYIHAAGAE